MFAVVEFIEEEGACGYISSKWFANTEKSKCYWPITNPSRLSKLRSSHAAPETHWPINEIRVLLDNIGDEKRARQSAKLAEETSNLESELDEVNSKRRKKTIIRFIDDYDQSPKKRRIDECEANISTPLASKINDTCKEFPITPGFLRNRQSTSANADNSFKSFSSFEMNCDVDSGEHLGDAISKQNSMENTTTELTRVSSSFKEEPLLPELQGDHFKMMKNWFKEVFICMARLEENQSRINEKLNRILRSDVEPYNKDNEEAFQGKKSTEELKSYLENLAGNERDSLVKYLSRFVSQGVPLNTNIFNLLILMAPSEIWQYFSRDGKKGKLSTKNMGLCGLLSDAVVYRTGGSIEKVSKKVNAALVNQLKRMKNHSQRHKDKAGRQVEQHPSRARPERANDENTSSTASSTDTEEI